MRHVSSQLSTLLRFDLDPLLSPPTLSSQDLPQLGLCYDHFRFDEITVSLLNKLSIHTTLVATCSRDSD